MVKSLRPVPTAGELNKWDGSQETVQEMEDLLNINKPCMKPPNVPTADAKAISSKKLTQ